MCLSFTSIQKVMYTDQQNKKAATVVVSNSKAAVVGSSCCCWLDSSLSDLAHSYGMMMTRKVSLGLAAKVNLCGALGKSSFGG